jgi:hypothetical protein
VAKRKTKTTKTAKKPIRRPKSPAKLARKSTMSRAVRFITGTKTVVGTTISFAPLHYAILTYYSRMLGVTMMQAARAIILMYARSDAKFDPEAFWRLGVLEVYEDFSERYMDDRPELVASLIQASLDFLDNYFDWKPRRKDIPDIPEF